MTKPKKQKIDTQKLVWLYPQNAAFVEGKSQSLANKDEVYKNIALNLGLPPHSQFNFKTTLFYGVWATAFWTFAILILLPLLTIFLEDEPIPITIFILLGSVIIALLIFFASAYAYSRMFIYSIIGNKKKVSSAYQNLIEGGTIQQARITRTDYLEQRIYFQIIGTKTTNYYVYDVPEITEKQMTDYFVRVLVSEDGIAIPL